RRQSYNSARHFDCVTETGCKSRPSQLIFEQQPERGECIEGERGIDISGCAGHTCYGGGKIEQGGGPSVEAESRRDAGDQRQRGEQECAVDQRGGTQSADRRGRHEQRLEAVWNDVVISNGTPRQTARAKPFRSESEMISDRVRRRGRSQREDQVEKDVGEK